jgi:phage gp36-like protein
MAYSTINSVSKKVDQSFFLQFLNDENRHEEEIDLEDETDALVNRFNQIANEVADEIDNFLRGRYKLPLTQTSTTIQSLSDDRTIYNVKKRRLRENMPESEQKIFDATTKTLQLIEAGKIALAIEPLTEGSTNLSGEINTNKSESDRIFNSDMWSRY